MTDKYAESFEVGEYVYQTNIGESTTNVILAKEWVDYMGGYWNYNIKNLSGWRPHFKLSKGNPEDVRMTKDEKIAHQQSKINGLLERLKECEESLRKYSHETPWNTCEAYCLHDFGVKAKEYFKKYNGDKKND